MNLLSQLNPQQRIAVTYTKGPILVLAGAGSGKTRVITYRIAYLIKEGIPPSKILAVTFTNKAAQEMRERVENLLRRKATGLWISTFHSACLRILRVENNNGVWSIYDEEEQARLIKEILKELNIENDREIISRIAHKISRAKERLIPPSEFQPKGYFEEKFVAQVYPLYQKKLEENSAYDFDDLIMKVINLWREKPEILRKYQEKFQHLLVDEYQDTNYAQYIFCKLLAEAHRNICVVGDDDQSIYSWRGAEIENIFNFEADFQAKVVRLEENYRSRSEILKVANKVIKYNFTRRGKNLWTRKKEPGKVYYYSADDEITEAEFVVNTIISLTTTQGYALGDFGVFYRVNAQSRVLEDVFIQAGVRYTIVGGISFYRRQEIKDILAYLRISVNPGDRVSLLRIINTPPRGIGQRSIEKIMNYVLSQSCSFNEVLKDPSALKKIIPERTRLRIEEFMKMLQYFQKLAKEIPVSQMVKEVLEETSYLKALEEVATPEAEARIENLKEFMAKANEFEEKTGKGSVEDFLNEVSLLSDIDTWQEDAHRVSLMTLHSAKGLEFPVVFIVGLEEGLLPHAKSVNDTFHSVEEECRLCYVGITRAKDRLYLSSALSRRAQGVSLSREPSRFLKELGITSQEILLGELKEVRCREE
jgi:DNA helicase-2/ATP-dependent DNA helicase PcrA